MYHKLAALVVEHRSSVSKFIAVIIDQSRGHCKVAILIDQIRADFRDAEPQSDEPRC